jgi:5-oxoprolinase (ATP-hydrolysing) subunit A
MMKIDLNCDMGESFGRYHLGEDEQVMTSVTSVNVACGLHAGDPVVMDATVRLAKQHGLAVGAHPGYPDLQGFGRREMKLSPEEAEAFVLYQIAALAGFASAHGVELVHVKPHGALYNQAARDRQLAAAVARGVRRFSPKLILVGLAGSELIRAGQNAGLNTASEGFPDRVYEPNGSLRSRSLPGALLETEEAICQQAVRLAEKGILVSSAGREERVAMDTLCIHGDHSGAARSAAAVRRSLEERGIVVTKLG